MALDGQLRQLASHVSPPPTGGAADEPQERAYAGIGHRFLRPRSARPETTTSRRLPPRSVCRLVAACGEARRRPAKHEMYGPRLIGVPASNCVEDLLALGRDGESLAEQVQVRDGAHTGPRRPSGQDGLHAPDPVISLVGLGSGSCLPPPRCRARCRADPRSAGHLLTVFPTRDVSPSAHRSRTALPTPKATPHPVGH